MPRKFKPRPQLLDQPLSDGKLQAEFLKLSHQHHSQRTVENYTRMLGYFFDFLQEHQLKLRELRTEDIDAFLAQYKRSTAFAYGLVVLNFLNFIGLTKRNDLVVDLPKVQRNKAEAIRRQLITEDELKAYLQACGTNHQAALIGAMLWETGIRVSELARILWGIVLRRNFC